MNLAPRNLYPRGIFTYCLEKNRGANIFTYEFLAEYSGRNWFVKFPYTFSYVTQLPTYTNWQYNVRHFVLRHFVLRHFVLRHFVLRFFCFKDFCSMCGQYNFLNLSSASAIGVVSEELSFSWAWNSGPVLSTLYLNFFGWKSFFVKSILSLSTFRYAQ
jgi:hypothetical protein